MQCEGHTWEVAPYFEPSPNGISFCYMNEDQLIVCKDHKKTPPPSATQSPYDGTSSTVMYLDAGESGPNTRVDTNPGGSKDSDGSSGEPQSLPMPSRLEGYTPRPAPGSSPSQDPDSPGYVVIPDTDDNGAQSAASKSDDQQGMFATTP